MTPLHWACRKNSIEEVKLLIEKEADINAADKDGVCPLKWCLALRNYEIAILLLELGCKIPANLQLSECFSLKKHIQKQNRIQLEQLIDQAAKEEKLVAQFLFPKSFPSLSSLSNLKTLSLRFNGLQEIPASIFTLEGLTELDVSHNLLERLPEDLSKLTRVETLNCSHNFLRKFGKGIDNLTSLNISHNLIDELSPDISRYYRLSNLNCSHNYLSLINRHIVEISTLERINFSHNYIKELRDIPIHILQFLVDVDLSYNRLTSVPYEDIMASRTIRSFGFTHNQFPLEYHRMMRAHYSLLDSLDLSNLGLTTVPDQLRLLTHLRDLNLRNNNLTVLPQVIGNLVELTNLDLSYNRLTDLPLFIRKLARLQSLNLEETKSFIVNPPKGVIERGLKSIMGHYEDLLQGEPCFRLKLMFVGQGNFFYIFHCADLN
jgi:Leucine-rich repeat (LRR) protein